MAQTLSPKAIQGITQLTGRPPVQGQDGNWYTAQGQPIHAFGDMATVDNGNGTHTWAAGGDGIGTTVNNESIGKFLLKAAPIVAGTLIGGSLLAGGGGAASAGGEAAGSGYAANAAAATEAQALSGAGAAGAGAGVAAAANPFKQMIVSGLISAGTGIGKGLIQSAQTNKAVAAETGAAKAASAQLDPYAQGGLAAWRQQLAKYGIVLPPSAGGMGPTPQMAPQAPSPVPMAQPMPAMAMTPQPAQGPNLATFTPDPEDVSRSSFGGR